MSEVIDHIGIRVSDLPASRRLYGAALAELGFVVLSEGEFEGDAYVLFGRGDSDDFCLHTVGNEPGRTSLDLDVETILRLAEIPRVAGLKEASSDFGKIARLMASVPEEFAVFSGTDATALAFIALGARGVISVAANEIPKEMSALVHAALEDRRAEALELQRKFQPLMEMNYLESNPGPVKCALSLMGRCGETLRLPLVPVRDEVRRRIEKTLAGYRLLRRKGR